MKFSENKNRTYQILTCPKFFLIFFISDYVFPLFNLHLIYIQLNFLKTNKTKKYKFISRIIKLLLKKNFEI